MRKPLFPAPPATAGSLAEALAAVPDPGQPYGWRPQYPPILLVALLQLAAAQEVLDQVPWKDGW